MSYATIAELKLRFADDDERAHLTDSAAGAAQDAVFTGLIDTAEGDINSALATRYATPVDVSVDTTLASLLEFKTIEMAEYFAYRRGEDASEVKRDQYDKVLEWLDKIVKGERVLVGAVIAASTTSVTPAAWTGSDRTLPDDSPRIFTRGTTGRL